MIFSFSEEHGELRDGLRRFLTDKSPSAEVRRLMDTDEGYDPKVWQQLAQQLGVTGLTIPEKFGGLGYGAVEQAIVLEEMGRALLCAPYLSTAVLAVQALLASGDAAAQEQHLPGIAEGTTIATVAVAEDDGHWDTAAMTTRAARAADGAGWRLDGRKSFVLDGHTADLIIVAAQTDGGPSLFAVAGDADGLTRQPLETLDRTRKLARLDLASTQAQLIGTEGGATAAVRRTLQVSAAALAAEQVGGAQRCLDMSVEYAKLRMQFGRPIARGRVRPVGGLLRGVGRGRGLRRAAAGGQPGQGLLLGGVLPGGRRQHPDPRRHRLHLGARRAPVLPAGQVVGADAGHAQRAPGDRRHVPDRRPGRPR
jgi:alkylation response protein AidB-like acyl-CoA dehydrogenase